MSPPGRPKGEYRSAKREGTSPSETEHRDPSSEGAAALAAPAGQIEAWEQSEVAGFLARQPERQAQFHTLGGVPLKRVCTELDTADTPQADIGLPGQYPYTRGPYPAMYVALARKRGSRLDRLSGTIQADILKEYQAQKEWIFPIVPSVRIVRD
jgi:methylmalonyl-CoA mutase N-terminal domain/subunit